MQGVRKTVGKKICLFLSVLLIFMSVGDGIIASELNSMTDETFKISSTSKLYDKSTKVSSASKLYDISTKTASAFKIANKSSRQVYLDEALGFKGSDALGAVRKFFNKNWNKGYHYNGAKYYHLNSGNVGININYHFGLNKQFKLREANGYGYNCTGVVTSVLYYSSKTKKSFGAYYKNLIDGQGLGRICNGFAWWNYVNKYNVKKYCAGRVSNNADVNRVLNKTKDLQTGYVIYFAPTVRGSDCHWGFYWGKDSAGNHMMRHSIWSGLQWSKAFPGARGTYDLYVIPLSHGKTGVYTKTFKIKIKRKVKKIKNTTTQNNTTNDNAVQTNDSKVENQTKSDNIESENQSEEETGEQEETENQGETETKNQDETEIDNQNEINNITSTGDVNQDSEINFTSSGYESSSLSYKNLSLKGDTYICYGGRGKKGVYKKAAKLKLNKKGVSNKTVKVKVKLIYENGKLRKYYISSVGKKKFSAKRKNKKMFWLMEKKGSTPKGYRYRNTTYCFRVEKFKKNRIRLVLYKSNTKRKNRIKSVKPSKTLLVKIR